MKQFGIILLGFSLAMITSCSSDKSEDDPLFPRPCD